MGRVVIGGSPYLLTPLQLMSCPSVLVQQRMPGESTGSALLCRLGWESSLDSEAGRIVIFLHVCIY
jgi:hypothetical protein